MISAQVLSEFYVVVTRKLDPGLPEETGAAMIQQMARLPVVPVDGELARCDRIWSEDLAHGATYGQLGHENPFV